MMVIDPATKYAIALAIGAVFILITARSIYTDWKSSAYAAIIGTAIGFLIGVAAGVYT